MKKIKSIIAGTAVIGSLLAFTTAASAAWDYRGRALAHDQRELAADRRELRHDFHRGAGPAEIARDRAALAHERREIWQDRRDWRYDRWGRYEGRRYGYSDWRRGWW
jgi:hypothetical protein